jgi:hypothetical protein
VCWAGCADLAAVFHDTSLKLPFEQQAATLKTSMTTISTEEAQLRQEPALQRERALEGLRRAPISGRLVIRLPPGLKGFENSSQGIELRDGDRFEIPTQPGIAAANCASNLASVQ